MANTTLKKGSSGSDVKKMQQSLIDAGYDVGSTGADGIYGSATEAAVRKYQQDNGLAVDGIAGDQTQGKLYGAQTASSSGGQNAQNNTQNNSQAAQAVPDYSQYQYDPASDQAYQQALAALQQAQSQMPTYQATYDQQLQDLYDQIVNREKFRYDLNADALYQQYRDQYATQGKLAMMDTMGQAQAMTGGYGNSYAQSVGQQAYQGYLQQLNDVIPELYGMALDQYNQEGQNLLNQYSMLGDMADTEYSRYQDALNQYWQNLSYQKQLADEAYDQGYNNWYNAYLNGYQAERDKIGDQQWQAEFDEAKRQYDQQYALAAKESSGSSSGGSSGGSSSGSRKSSGGGYDNGKLTSSQVKALQNALGVTADGKYGSQSQKAAGGLSAEEAYEKYVGGDGSDGVTVTAYDQLVNDLNDLIAGADANGKRVSKGEINSVIREALQEGIITQSQAQSLMNTFAPRGLTY